MRKFAGDQYFDIILKHLFLKNCENLQSQIRSANRDANKGMEKTNYDLYIN